MQNNISAQTLFVPNGSSGISNTILGNNNIGIGTNNPWARLSVVGNLMLHNGSDNMFYDLTYTDGLPIPGHATIYQTISRWGGEFIWRVGSSSGTTEIMKLSANNSNLLRLDGEFRARTVRVTQNIWADYVFEPNFKLRSLQEVENFINTHKHLPDVPAQKEIKDKGLDVGEMQKIQMQKIEELTLYLIEQSKQIQALQEENKALLKRLETLETKKP